MTTNRDDTESIPGSFVSIGSGRESFHPETLPPSSGLDFSEETHAAIANATYALGRLDEAARTVELGAVVFTSMVRQEAVDSAAIEGADVDVDEVYQHHTTTKDQEDVEIERDLQEVLNYETALYRGIEAIDDGEELSEELLHLLHETLLAGTARADTDTVGKFRSTYVHLGEFVPPPPDQVRLLVENMLKFVRDGGTYSTLVDLALFHYQFETAHPYEDGNGRLGRLLITLQLYADGILSKPYLYPSGYFNRHKGEYIERLQGVRYDGDFEAWVRFFVEGIGEQAVEAYRRTTRLRDLREAYEQQFGDRKNASQRLALELFENPYVTAASVMELLDVSDGTAYNAIEELETAGILTETTKKKRNKEYKAAAIFEIIE